MAWTAVGIANRALTICGTKGSVASLTESSPEARAINRHYDNLRDELLIEIEPYFARNWATLAQEADHPSPDKYLYAYALPADMLKLRYVHQEKQYGYGYELQGESLLTDADTCNVSYVQQVTDEGKFPVWFGKLFAYRLAALVCMTLVSDPQKAQIVEAMARDVTEEVGAINAVQDYDAYDYGLDPWEDEADWLEDRHSE